MKGYREWNPRQNLNCQAVVDVEHQVIVEPVFGTGSRRRSALIPGLAVREVRSRGSGRLLTQRWQQKSELPG